MNLYNVDTLFDAANTPGLIATRENRAARLAALHVFHSRPAPHTRYSAATAER